MSLVRPGQKTEVLALSWHFSFPQVTLVDDAKDLLSVGWWYNDASSLQQKILYVVSFISGNFAMWWARLSLPGVCDYFLIVVLGDYIHLCTRVKFPHDRCDVSVVQFCRQLPCIINALARFWWDLMLLILLLKYENHLSQIPLGACCHPSVHLHQNVLFLSTCAGCVQLCGSCSIDSWTFLRFIIWSTTTCSTLCLDFSAC